jgi:beta-lactamase class A
MKHLTCHLFVFSFCFLFSNSYAVQPGSEGMTMEQFQERILQAVQEKEEQLGCRIGLSFEDSELPLKVEHRADELFHAASTMKVPVMIEVFRQAEQGKFDMMDKIEVDPIFHSMIDDSTFECGGYQYIQSKVGQEETLLKLTEKMIVISDNLASNLLITLCGPRKITATARKLGAEKTLVLRCLMDIPAYEAGLSNRLTPNDLTVLFKAIEEDRAAGEESCEEMRRILLEQEHNNMIPARLPEGVKVGHKTGAIEGVRHDAGTVYWEDGKYYLALLTDQLKDGGKGVEAIADLSKLIHELRVKVKNK